MKTTIHGIFLLIFSILQATWLDCIEIFGIKPNLFLIYILVICCFCGRVEGAAVGFAFGFALDMLVGQVWGINALLGMLLGFCTANFCERVLSESNFFITLALVLVGSLLYETFYYSIAFLRSESSSFFPSLIKTIIPECLYNIVVSAPLYFIVKHFARLLYTDKGDAIG